jgi:hypothetical protein
MKTRTLSWLALAAATALLAACGGGSDAPVAVPLPQAVPGGTPTALAGGIVTGFGSVIVDGKRWDDRNARTERARDDNPSASDLTEAKLGHRVEIEFESDGVAKTMRVEAEVLGRVSAVDAVKKELRIAGQLVRTNTDPAAGPVTIYADGYTQFSDIKLDDVAEVHGLPRYDSATSRYVIEASRIEKKATLPAGIARIAGVVTAYDPAARTFKLGDLVVSVGSALVVPANRSLANDIRVVVWTTAISTGPAATASFIRIKERSEATGLQSEVAGRISKFDAAAASFELGGIKVNARSAIVVPANQSLAADLYVVARGTFATDGALNATQVRIRKFELSATPEAELRGTITDYKSLADFKVRGVAVDASTATVTRCPATLANGLFVQVEGRLTTTGVKASSVKCEDASAGLTVELKGVASSVDTTARTFTLTPASGSARSVRWTELTFFRDVTAATLAGKTVEVEGYEVAGVLVASKIKLGS